MVKYLTAVVGAVYNNIVIFNSDLNKYISAEEENSDYQEYLAWIAEGNTPGSLHFEENI